MTIQEINGKTDIAERVNELKKGRLTPLPEITKYLEQWDPAKHAIFDNSPTGRPDKTVYYTDFKADGTPYTSSRMEKVARVAVSLQKLIVKRAAAFLFGNPVKAVPSQDNSKVADAVDRILRDAKQDSLNRKIARALFATTEVAEYWYGVKAENAFETYGFKTDVKIKCTVFSPLKGDVLYPFFSETGDMVAFSREYKVKENGAEVLYFETWTAEKYTRYKQDQGQWADALDGREVTVQLGKIPVIYASQEAVEWSDVQFLIDRLEKLLSNFADTIDYHASPKHVVSGEVQGYTKKGDAGGILQLNDGAEIKVLTWDQEPAGVKFEVENLLRLIHTLTQTPDISFDAVKGLGSAASGQSLRMLFLDAHLKVMDKLEIFDDYLQRRLNILKAFVGKLNSPLQGEADKLELTPVVIPYMVDDQKDKIDNLVTAVTGGIMSKQSAVMQNPLVEDGEKEMDLMEKETKAQEVDPGTLDDIQNE